MIQDNSIKGEPPMNILNSLLFQVSKYLKCKQITGERGQPYLERYMIARWGKDGEHTIFLHRFLDSDADQGVHDHPWESKSFILTGGYTEERLVKENVNGKLVDKVILRDVNPLSFNTIGKNDFHRIILKPKVAPWTLFYHGPRVKDWGFLKCFGKDISNKVESSEFTKFNDPTNPNVRWEDKALFGKDLDRQVVDYIYTK